MNMNKLIDLTKPIYTKDKDDGEVNLVDSIHLPLGKPSGKDIAVIANDDNELIEWRAIDDVELFQK